MTRQGTLRLKGWNRNYQTSQQGGGQLEDRADVAAVFSNLLSFINMPWDQSQTYLFVNNLQNTFDITKPPSNVGIRSKRGLMSLPFSESWIYK